MPARCVGALSCASWKTRLLGPNSFRAVSEGIWVGSRFRVGCEGFPAISGSPSCPRLQVPGSGLNVACTDGEDRFGAMSPATGSNLDSPGRHMSRPGGREMSSAILPGLVTTPGQGRQVATGGSRP